MKNDRRPFGRKETARRVNFREVVQRFLIVCVGERTEEHYFSAFRVPKDVRTIQVVGTGKDPETMINIAVRERAKAEYDQVWCVFDVDDFSPNQINRALVLAQNERIRVAVSNQCFELWYLLHFHYYNTAIARKQYESRLTELLDRPYRKNCRTLYADLMNRQAEAIKNARRLLSDYSPYDPARNDPSTTVFQLVEELNKFTPESRRGAA